MSCRHSLLLSCQCCIHRSTAYMQPCCFVVACIKVTSSTLARQPPDRIAWMEMTDAAAPPRFYMQGLVHAAYNEACTAAQGTEKTEETLNIFLEYVPGGSIASLLAKFGTPLFSAYCISCSCQGILLLHCISGSNCRLRSGPSNGCQACCAAQTSGQTALKHSETALHMPV